MKTIELSQGYVAMVDDEDYEMLSKHNWCAEVTKHIVYGMASIYGPNRKKTTIRMHRLILGVTDPKIHVDHKDRDGRNNQKENLRIVTHAQNMMNRKRPIQNTSGFKGVHPHKQSGKWRATIAVNGKDRSLGLFLCPIEAAKAYDTAAKVYYGEFARLNFPESP